MNKYKVKLHRSQALIRSEMASRDSGKGPDRRYEPPPKAGAKAKGAERKKKNGEESSDAEARDQDMTRAFAQLSDSYRRRHAEKRAASTRKTALFNGTLN